MAKEQQPNWTAVTPSAFPWEQDALDFIRTQFPAHEPYRAWSNFEFLADDGSINEVDLLVFTPQGFFLIEIKSRPGMLSGDARTWTWQHDGKTHVLDNPIFLANQKAKKLASLLQRQRAAEKLRIPFIEPLIFCSDKDLECRLQGNARFHVCLRDAGGRDGIMAAIKNRVCPGLSAEARGTFDRPTAKVVGRALERAGIRPSPRTRRVSDFELGDLLDEGPGYQDFLGTHVSLRDTFRRIRIYLVQSETSPEQRAILQRAAEREFRLLQTLEHRGVLRALQFTHHELGPAIIFHHLPNAVRLDHYLVEQKTRITDDIRLSLMRQIAETIGFAHQKHVVHRALSPRAVLVVNPESSNPQAVIMNWQLGYRQTTASQTVITQPVTATIHLEPLVEDSSKLFMAPETLLDTDTLGEHHDIFSLGAICYQLFTGELPADSPLALAEKLRTHRGLRVSAVLNGAPEALDELVQFSTDPNITCRLDTAEEFLESLDKVEDELTTPSNQLLGDPTLAKPDDVLPGGYKVLRKLGTGSTATAFLVEHEDHEFVVKIAVDVEHNDRVRDEGEVLAKLDSPLIVRCHGIQQIGDRTAILLDRAGKETLRERIKQEGRLSLDLLERFGRDLLEAVVVLEREGIAHRDIKPDNIGVSFVGSNNELHLVLFDFSLSRCSRENIRAGTPGFIDPFLPTRKPPRWDLHAERYSAAVTLYHMATGVMPTWSGGSDPALVDSEVTLDADHFDPNLRDDLTRFFGRALRRNARERFDNASQMLEAWTNVFSSTTGSGTITTEGTEGDNAELLALATADTTVAELGLGPAAVDALDRVNVLKVRDLLKIQGRRLARMRGVGNKTRKRILAAVKVLRERLEDVQTTDPSVTNDAYSYGDAFPTEKLGLDVVSQQILKAKAKSRNATENTALEALLGLDLRLTGVWPNQGEVATLVGVTRARISQILAEALKRWVKDPAITSVRTQIAAILEENGGVMSAEELAVALLTLRGSREDDPRRSRLARVVTRAAVETENTRDEPRYIFRRHGENAFIATDMSLADYAVELGAKADTIAEADPLLPPARVVETLRAVPLPVESEPLSDVRLVRLAAAASESAAVSSKQELYPRGLDPARAIKLSQGALVGSRCLKIEHIKQRVSSRYPLAAPLPPRPQLDQLLADAGLLLVWDPDLAGGSYRSTARNVLSVTDASSTLSRYPTLVRTPTVAFRPNFVDPEIAEATAFEERLRYAERDGSFLALTVKPGLYERAREELTDRFKVRPLDLERVLFDALRAASQEVGADWGVVIKADAADHSTPDWRNLNHLIAGNVIPRVQECILNPAVDDPNDKEQRTVLIYYLNWLARYDQLPLLSRVQQAVLDGRLHGAWLLVPITGPSEMPLLDGKAVPVITPNQWAHIPEGWCQNRHRTRAEPSALSG